MTITPHPQHPREVPQFDDTALAIVRDLIALRHLNSQPEIGDLVDFTDGETLRIAHIWPDGIQTARGGSFHLTDSGYMSFSGSLYSSLPTEAFTTTGAMRPAAAWIFHHDIWGAGYGVHFDAPVQVWSCDLPAPQ